MEVFIKYELKNIAPRFHRAIWRRDKVMRGYASAKEARKFHNLKNCCYEYRVGDKVVACYNNANIDAYGRRYRGSIWQ